MSGLLLWRIVGVVMGAVCISTVLGLPSGLAWGHYALGWFLGVGSILLNGSLIAKMIINEVVKPVESTRDES